MKINILSFAAFVLMISCLIQCHTNSVVPSQDQLFKGSDYIFTGKIVQSQASNVIQIKNTENTSIVEVRNVLKASPGHEHFKGKNITMVNNSGKQFKEGEEHLFFTKTWLFAETLAVILKQVNPVSDEVSIIEEMKKYDQKLYDDNLKVRLERSQLVFLGEVTDINEADLPQTSLSEHAPYWKTAFVEVREPLKGNFAVDKIQVYFSGSMDTHWYKSPKLQAGDKGIFLLNRRDEYNGLKNAFVLVDKEDYRSANELENIKELLK